MTNFVSCIELLESSSPCLEQAGEHLDALDKANIDWLYSVLIAQKPIVDRFTVKRTHTLHKFWQIMSHAVVAAAVTQLMNV